MMLDALMMDGWTWVDLGVGRVFLLRATFHWNHRDDF